MFLVYWTHSHYQITEKSYQLYCARKKMNLKKRKKKNCINTAAEIKTPKNKKKFIKSN